MTDTPASAPDGETVQALVLANRVLDIPYIDPDSDICVLARQFLRTNERLNAFITRVAELEASKNGAYSERNQVVAALARLFPSGIKPTDIPGWDPEWHGCVFIDTPVGQCSWHYHDSEAHLFADLPPYEGEWDGHSTEEKYERLAALGRQERA